MKWLWNWLFPKPNLVRPFGEVGPGMKAVITEYRPDLLNEFHAVRQMPLPEMGRWLDKHFPRKDMRWGLTSATQAHVNLRRYLENANVGR